MKKHLITLLLGTLTALPAMAAWQVVDDFEDGDVTNWRTGWQEAAADPANPPTIKSVAEPFGGAGKVLEVFPGGLLTDTVNLRAWVDLPQPVVATQGQLVTLYFRVARPLVAGAFPAEVDTVWGLVPLLIDTATGQPKDLSAYGDFSVLARYEKDGYMDVYDGGPQVADPTKVIGYVTTQPIHNTDTWYHIWVVVDHFANSYKYYIQGGTEFPTQTLLYPPDGTADPLYRKRTADNLIQFAVMCSTGNVATGAKGRDPTYFDDLYLDTSGANLTVPGAAAPKWAGEFDVDGSGNAWTDTWMGAINVNQKPWIFVYSLNQWVYIPEDMVSGSGAWGYINR